jgi:hypothetical protein
MGAARRSGANFAAAAGRRFAARRDIGYHENGTAL